MLLVAIALLVGGAQAYWSLTFQNPSAFSAQIKCTGACYYFQNATGGNNYVITNNAAIIKSLTPLPMTYSAATVSGGDGVAASLYDSTGAQMALLAPYTPTGRAELKVGTTATLYVDGTPYATSGALSQNPSYIGWSEVRVGGDLNGTVDDVIWGDTAPRYIFGMPESGYYLMKDMVTPSASGFYRVNQTNPNGSPSLIYSNFFPSTFGKNSGTNETVVLTSPTGGTQLTYATGTAYAGTITWNLTKFFAQNPPYGLYQTTINPQLNSPGYAVSSWIPYIGDGASIWWDKNNYTQGQTATISVNVGDQYYDLSKYSYYIKITDANLGLISSQVVTLTPSSPHTGNIQYTWTSNNVDGQYYGMLWATPKAGGNDILMNYATAGLSSILTIDGFVFDAQTTNPIVGATVNITQAATTDTVLSGSNGNYTSVSSFTANAPTTLNATAVGYEAYQAQFTPLYAGELQINITLMPLNTTYTGIALGGIARSPPYNRTVDSAIISIQNATAGGNYTATTNSVGFYIQNNMPNSYIWNIWGNKTGYQGSPIYQKLVVGI